jgi:hypothetical protein
MSDIIRPFIDRVSTENLSAWLKYLVKDPLPCRTMNYKRPGASVPTLYEADAYIADTVSSFGYTVEREACQVQAYRCDEKKPIHHQYSAPLETDPWYTAYNLYAMRTGTKFPKDLIVVISHKDSQSWVKLGPGAHDNGVGTVANMELARVLADYTPQRSIWHVWCNEEHTPWTSAVTAKRAKDAGMNLVGALNVDSFGGKSEEERGHMTNVTAYATPEGERIADRIAELNEKYAIGVEQRKHAREFPNDDDGSFVKAGMPAAVANVGSFPYVDPAYHLTDDKFENVDPMNQLLVTRLILATILDLDQNGSPV